MTIRKERTADIEPHFADQDYPVGDIRARLHTGTSNTATWLAVPVALDPHDAIGGKGNEARLRHLRDYWVEHPKDVAGLQILTPDGSALPLRHHLCLAGKTTAKENVTIATRLREQYGVLSVRRGASPPAIAWRATPALYMTHRDLDRLVAALREIAAG